MITTILGIDPGLSGALAFLGPNGLTIHDMPTLTAGKRREIDEIELARIIDAAGTITGDQGATAGFLAAHGHF